MARRHVSIHASARDATPAGVMFCISLWFQSTRPRGTRPNAAEGVYYTVQVSIHASARDATQNGFRFLIRRCFNPRVRAGRDFRMTA